VAGRVFRECSDSRRLVAQVAQVALAVPVVRVAAQAVPVVEAVQASAEEVAAK
jgi:hypothetical protein